MDETSDGDSDRQLYRKLDVAKLAPGGADWLKPRGHPWRVQRSERVHDNPWFRVDAYDAVAPTGRPASYFQVHMKAAAVGVLPLHEDGTVTLVGQWRFPFRAYSWEMPEGGAPRSEDPLDGAKRELREEAGLVAAAWRRVLVMQLSNASSDEVAHLFLATDLTPTAASPDPTEDLAIARVPFREALTAALDALIQDSLTVAMLLRVHHMATAGELPPALARTVLA